MYNLCYYYQIMLYCEYLHENVKSFTIKKFVAKRVFISGMQVFSLISFCRKLLIFNKNTINVLESSWPIIQVAIKGSKVTSVTLKIRK